MVYKDLRTDSLLIFSALFLYFGLFILHLKTCLHIQLNNIMFSFSKNIFLFSFFLVPLILWPCVFMDACLWGGWVFEVCVFYTSMLYLFLSLCWLMSWWVNKYMKTNKKHENTPLVPSSPIHYSTSLSIFTLALSLDFKNSIMMSLQ